MNKAITDGAELMPPAYAQAFDAYSGGSGEPGASGLGREFHLVQGDPDFGTCLELEKTESLHRLRYRGETPLLPGCYLRVSVRIKLLEGPAPSVRIAGFAGGPGGGIVADAQTEGPSLRLGAPGEIVEVSAIVGPGARLGVDMVWGPDALYGHFGLDVTGPKGARLRIDRIVIDDVTSVFFSQQLSQIDVRDFGAAGDGITDDSDAFEAADAAAEGRSLLVPRGCFFLGRDVALSAQVRFEGRVAMPEAAVLLLCQQFDLPSYAAAFADMTLALRKGLQALMAPDAPNRFDMKGLAVTLSEPLRLPAPRRTATPHVRKTLCNGQITAAAGPDWIPWERRVRVEWSPDQPRVLSDAAIAGQVPPGAHVAGAGVEPEIYVGATDAKAGLLTLNGDLGGGAGQRDLTLTRFRYLLDFSAMPGLYDLTLSNIELCCEGLASGILLPPRGANLRLQDCTIRDMRDRGLTSCGTGCTGLVLDRSAFVSRRRTALPHLGFNAGSSGLRIVNCRSDGPHMLGHFAGAYMLMSGCHLTNTTGAEHPGLVLARGSVALLVGNHFEDCTVVVGEGQDILQPDGNLFSTSGD
ncbi:right-handed parallel beta-helix repeat-containing protein [Roseobacter sinensis]|uniref:Right-handed parallel beta-helix repeat-containing protein n=1 Tax=Roseobacter sinensis TaxID=2931391 RepID=A0ABT3BD80_9RHOB|nr:right-handed parallel beta-helix repeat-containing protein [Roseobacter sp. WL0113]MCV3271528.1 right-handed parallel beta-helix repeat-containing protein [Roseobacter sp. WL0113]